ncbi:MAG: flavoprotein [Phycisphaerae bacterium]|jgi:phosphopantothenoylcysteine decarboxylase/phosphopantothenate--cysteine ligase
MAGPENDTSLADYEVLLCVTGGIACYKSADLASKLVGCGAGVSVAMTEAAIKFIAPVTFQALTLRPVFSSMWVNPEDYRADHIALTEKADLMIVAPATANVLAKFATGIADDLISTMYLAASGTCPLLVAPAMNTRMWNAPPVQANIQRLREWGVQFIGPAEGKLACRTVGMGRMSEPADILAAAKTILLARPPKKVGKG